MPELDRRNFLKAVGLSAGAAATVACKDPVETVIPYLNQPEEIIPGIPTYYASTCRECPTGCSIQVKTREGRPLKVEGNPADPRTEGSVCIRGQAGLARTYDTTRFRGPQKRDGDALVPVSWEEALATLTAKLGPAAAAGKVAFLSGHERGTFGALIGEFMSAIGSPRHIVYEPFGYEPLRAANQKLFGVADVPQLDFALADVVVSFGADFLETYLDASAAQVGFANARRGGRGFAVYVGPRLSLSGSNCDAWLSPDPGTEIFVALGLAHEVAKLKPSAELAAVRAVLEPHSLSAVSAKTGIPAERLELLAKKIAEADAPLALPPGNELQGSNATAFAAAVQLLNLVSGAVGTTMRFADQPDLAPRASYADLKQLATQLSAGEVDVLFVHGANPVYSAPKLGLDAALRKSFVVSFASANDETAALADLVLPDHTPFEAWGDSTSGVGVRTLQQPTIQPIFDTRQTADVLLELARKLEKPVPGPASLKDRLAAAWGDLPAALATGGSFEQGGSSAVAPVAGVSGLSFEAAVTGEGDYPLYVYPSHHFYDGRSARIAMLQEVPDPVTKMVWGSYLELHPDTAEKLGIEEGDVVRVSTAAGEVELPAFPHSAIRAGVLAIAAGQGHQPLAPNWLETEDRDRLQRSKVIGVNALSLLPDQVEAGSGALVWASSKAKVAKTGEKKWLAKPQTTFDQEGRGIAQAVSLAALVGGASAEEAHGGAEKHGGETGEQHDPPYADALHLETEEFDPARDAINADYRWGMSVDLDACSGCGACITACATENNVFTIGEELVRAGREMAWIRLERYVEQHGDEIEVRHVPMMCQHCGAAPCEPVCPVFATYHNPEGLNVMVPNRCIGTRYCGNNCPYKVRRFNYFAFDRDVRAPEQFGLNPDVIVRSKGVMEKCSFCVQRINAAKDKAVGEGRTVRDGEITPACAQTCPSKAIVFGNHKDATSEVSKRREDPRAYWVFHHLNTRPAVTYQKSIRRNETEEA